MNSNIQGNVMPEDRREYMEIKTRLERDPDVRSSLKDIVSSYECIKPRARDRLSSVTELILELEQRLDINIDACDISSMGFIVDKCRSENVKEAFRSLREKLQRQTDAIPISRVNHNASSSRHDPTGEAIRVPTSMRRMLMENFEKLGWGEAEYFLQTLGHGLEGRNEIMTIRQLNQHQIHVCLARFQTISEKVDNGLEIFETNSQEDNLFSNENELLDHVVTVLRQIDLNRMAKNISVSRGRTVFHNTIF